MVGIRRINCNLLKFQLNPTHTDSATGYQQQIENYFHDNKEKSEKIEQLYESRIKVKEAIIEQLQKKLDKFSK